MNASLVDRAGWVCVVLATLVVLGLVALRLLAWPVTPEGLAAANSAYPILLMLGLPIAAGLAASGAGLLRRRPWGLLLFKVQLLVTALVVPIALIFELQLLVNFRISGAIIYPLMALTVAGGVACVLLFLRFSAKPVDRTFGAVPEEMPRGGFPPSSA